MKWPQQTLGDVFEIARGGSPRPIDRYLTTDPDGVNWVMISDASSSEKFITSTKKRILKSGVSRSRMVHPGDFLLTNSMSFGRPYIMRTAGCIHDGWLVLSKRIDNVDSDFFFHLLGSAALYSEFERRAAGATVKNLNIDLVKSVTIPLPPLAEQKRIAGILDAADALRAKRRESLAQLDSLLQSTFLTLFGDPVSNPMGWDRCLLDQGCERIVDCPHSTPSWTTSGVICLRTSNLGYGEWDWTDTRYVTEEDYLIRTKRSEIAPGDLILSREGTVGVLAMVKDGMRICMGQRLVQVRPARSHFEPQYLLHILLHDLSPSRLGNLMAGSTSKHLNVKDLRSLPIPLPPLPLQRRFAAIVESVERQKARQRAHLAELDALFAALQHRAFRGEL